MTGNIMNNILIVEDDKEYQMIIHRFLSGMGYLSEQVATYEEAKTILARKSFDLVISDINLGSDKNGLELMKDVQQECRSLDFMIMTGYTAEYSYVDIIRAGAADFIPKPVQFEELEAKLKRLEREKQTLRALEVTRRDLIIGTNINTCLVELSRSLLSQKTFEEMSSLCLEHARYLTGSPIGFAGYIDHHTGQLHCPTLSEDVCSSHPISHEPVIFKDFTGLWGWVLKTKGSVLTNSPADDPRSSGTPEGHVLIHRFLSAPALAGEEVLGQIALANSDRDYAEPDLSVVETIAGIYGQAIQRKWMEEELKEEIARRAEAEAELRKAHSELQILLADRNARISQAGELLKKRVERFKQITDEA
ncbi:MAG: GAF domain-containing protein [Deltaproteobacteria bacterium]|nr:GAF domain-containing protein [Deltaproteobacteria bacterium]MBF0524996.1 GAF domain-containing protein [Deltaproteobacteria bacterium]